MGVVVVTGSAGLIGAEAVRFLAAQGFDVVGIDNDMRRVFFGNDASTAWSRQRLEIEVKSYRHIDGDIRDAELMNATFAQYGKAIDAVIHTAAQPSHDWAARNPQVDFTVNTNGTLNWLLCSVPAADKEMDLGLGATTQADVQAHYGKAGDLEVASGCFDTIADVKDVVVADAGYSNWYHQPPTLYSVKFGLLKLSGS